MKKFGMLLIIFLSFIFIRATASGANQPVSASAGKNWQQKWDKIVSEAVKEGVVVIGSSAGPQIRNGFSKAFTGKYGVKLEFISGKPAELVPKIQVQRRAGIYINDIIIAGTGTVVPMLGAEGALEPLDDALVLPEVTEGKNWWGGELLWTDPAHRQVAFLAFPGITTIINTSQVRTEEIRSYRDLLNPRWKGKVSCLDPTMAGESNSLFTFIAESSLGLEYLRELGRQEPVFTKDSRILIEWVARGKYPVAIGTKPEVITEFRKAGAPIAMLRMAEGSYIESAGGGVLLMNKAPHPNAALLFLNWLLSREGQMVASEGWGAQSAREDVPIGFLDSIAIRQNGIKYQSLIGEGMEKKKRETMKLTGEIWGHLLK